MCDIIEVARDVIIQSVNLVTCGCVIKCFNSVSLVPNKVSGRLCNLCNRCAIFFSS